MDKISINLLPTELIQSKKKQSRRSIVIRSNIAILALMILVTAGVLGYGIFLSTKLSSVKSHLEETKNQVGTLKEKEEIILNLKSRLAAITQIDSVASGAVNSFYLMQSLIPEGVSIQNYSLTPGGQVTVQGEAQNSKAMNEYFNNLTDPKKHNNKIGIVKIENINRGIGSQIRFDLLMPVSAPGAKPEASKGPGVVPAQK